MVSSGQARVIALTARINDLEFQGQQINQQRTTLANKSSEFYNSMLDMNVPTPPSKTDFTKIVYKGVQSASKFKLENVSPTADGKYNLRLGYEQQGLAMKKSTAGVIVSHTLPSFDAKVLDKDDILKEYYANDAKSVTVTHKNQGMTEEEFYAILEGDDTDGQHGVNTDILVKTTVGEYNTWLQGDGKNAGAPIALYDSQGKPVDSLEGKASNVEVYVRCNIAEFCEEQSDGTYGPKTDSPYAKLIGVDANEDLNYNKLFAIDSETPTKVGKTDNYIAMQNLYYTTGSSDEDGQITVQIKTAADLEKAVKAGKTIIKRSTESGTGAYKNPDYVKGEDNYSIGNSPAFGMNTDNAKKALGDSYESMLLALKHSFPEIEEAKIAESFLVYKDGDNGWKFIKRDSISSTNEQSSVTTYQYDESGTYTEHKDYTGAEMKFDTNTGRITQIGIPEKGSNGETIIRWVDVTAEETNDDDAYEAAYNEYEYDKYLYDKKQNDINAQLSIIQAEDRNLELKLTRLDNERNALTTELEAVKKVVKEGGERGAKTFNG